MKRIILISVCVLLSLTASAQTEEARYNYYDKTIVRNADGSTDFNVKFSLTLFTHTAMNSTYGQTYVIYNPDHQKVVVNEAYTVQKSGKKVVMPDRALTDALPSWAAKASGFNHLKEKIIIHTGLDIGSTIYVDYTVHSDAGFNKNFDFTDSFDATSPIAKFSYTITVPEKTPLKTLMCSPDGEILPVTDKAEGGERTLKYIVDNIPARSRDAFQVRNVTKHYNFFCTASDFSTEMKEFFSADIDPNIQRWAEDYMKAEPNGENRYNYIRSYVADNFEVISVPLTATYAMRPVSVIRQGAYITPYEQANLLRQMLVACNIQADVRASFDSTLPAEFRTLCNVRKFYVAEHFGDTEKTLDPTNSSDYADPMIQVGVDREIVKPDKGLEIKEEKFELEVKMSDLNDKGFYVLELPENPNGVAGWSMSLLPTKREVKFEVPRLVEEYDMYTIKVDSGIEMSKLPHIELSDGKIGVAMLVTSEVADDGTVHVARLFSMPQKVFSVEEYSAVRNIIAAWLDKTALLFTVKH